MTAWAGVLFVTGNVIFSITLRWDACGSFFPFLPIRITQYCTKQVKCCPRCVAWAVPSCWGDRVWMDPVAQVGTSVGAVLLCPCCPRLLQHSVWAANRSHMQPPQAFILQRGGSKHWVLWQRATLCKTPPGSRRKDGIPCPVTLEKMPPLEPISLRLRAEGPLCVFPDPFLQYGFLQL